MTEYTNEEIRHELGMLQVEYMEVCQKYEEQQEKIDRAAATLEIARFASPAYATEQIQQALEELRGSDD